MGGAGKGSGEGGKVVEKKALGGGGRGPSSEGEGRVAARGKESSSG